MSPRVVGLDLSMTATGIADDDGHTSTIKPRTSGDRRLVEIAANAALAAIGSDLAVIEDLPPIRAYALGILGMVHGAVRTALLGQGVPYALVPPMTLKKYATGKGNADKTAMALALYKRAGLELADDNQVDAWWLRAAGLQLLGEPLVQLPAVQVAALEAVKR